MGSSNHLAGELLQSVSGVPLTHVPYKGSTPALTDLIGGQIAFMFAGVGQMLPFMSAGKVRVIGTADSVRHPRLPDVPTMEEAGLKGFDLPAIYHALVGPLKLPQPIVARLNQAARSTLVDPDIAAQLNKQGYDVTPTTPEELGALMRRNFDTWGRIVRAAKIEKI
jgi:tripartite-type tricarboxylate transporter receptor subunit TctC